MKKGLIISLTAGIMALLAISCNKADNALKYNNMTMGNIVDGVFTSDEGSKFNIIEQNCTGKLDTMKRAFILCDIIRHTPNFEDEYDIRLNYMAKVLTKEAVALADIEDPDTYMNDPILISDLWISGGYLNMHLTFPVARDSKKVHEINLLHEFKDGVYKFQLRHDAQEEILKDGIDNSAFVLAGAYVSFPITSIIKEDKAKFTLDWKSYIVKGNLISAETTTASETRDYIKSTFEQVPSTAASTALSYSIE